jgi:curli biogenesis system outer membrane secretion channel CsgG
MRTPSASIRRRPSGRLLAPALLIALAGLPAPGCATAAPPQQPAAEPAAQARAPGEPEAPGEPTATGEPAAPAEQAAPATTGGAPPAAAAPIPIAVLPLGLTDETRRHYPQLSDRGVGFGVHNMLVDELYDTGRFRFVEEKSDVVEDLLNRQWVASTGAVDAASAVAYGNLLGARYVVYGEVFEFGVRTVNRKLVETRIALQVRIVDVETTEFVPASGSGSVEVRKRDVFPLGDEVEFARSTVGLATEQALAAAVPELMRRFVQLDRGGGGRR